MRQPLRRPRLLTNEEIDKINSYWANNPYNYVPSLAPVTQYNEGVIPAMPAKVQIPSIAPGTVLTPVRNVLKTKQIEKGLKERLIGQDHAVDEIIPYIRTFSAGLSMPGRPVANFMLVGPTGTGKTLTVEALSTVLHGKPSNVLKVDCGEFQSDHEIAKLLGSPPGYLGHRETTPLINQAKLTALRSETSLLELVLFDEIEKAAPTLMRLLLGILDKGTLNLGDNSKVIFSNSIIFMTSNVGAESMQRLITPTFGFEGMVTEPTAVVDLKKIKSIAENTIRSNRKFSPEFLNRVDAIIPYSSLGKVEIAKILELELKALQGTINSIANPPQLDFSQEAKDWLTLKGFNPRYGARELKRILQKDIMQKLTILMEEESNPGTVRVIVTDGELCLV